MDYNSNVSNNPKSRRSFKNVALQPMLQVKIGIYCIFISVFLGLSVGGIIYLNMRQFFQVIVELTGAQDEVKGLMLDYMKPAVIEVGIAIGLYIIAIIFVTLLYTHRFVGPTIAFRRHIQMISKGNYKYKTILREGDAFSEVANDLNSLSELLESRSLDAKMVE